MKEIIKNVLKNKITTRNIWSNKPLTQSQMSLLRKRNITVTHKPCDIITNSFFIDFIV